MADLYIEKNWKERVSEYPNRRILTKTDQSTEIVTVERSEGTITEEGDAWNAANMNAMEKRVQDGFDLTKLWTKYTIDTSGWSSTTTTVGGVEYYTYIINPAAIYIEVPQITIAPVGNDILPTYEQLEAYLLISLGNGYAYLNTTESTITLYAKQVPAAVFAIYVKGVQ